MKQFTVLASLFSITMLAVWIVFQLFSASAVKTRNVVDQTLSPGQAGNEAPVSVTSVDAKTVAPAPVYDASGRIVSLNPNGSSVIPIILAPASNMKIAPVYDASGRLVSDPSGTISNSDNP